MGRGQRTGGGWGTCTTEPATGAGPRGRAGQGGRSHRNWFHATGLTGWQRAARTEFVPAATFDAPAGRIEQLEDQLEQALARLEVLEARESK